MENSIVITSSDLVEHTVLARKRTESVFRKEFLERKGANSSDPHVAALAKQIEEIDQRLKPLDEKLKHVDIVSFVPNRAQIISLTAEIEQHSRDRLEEAMKTKTGAVYDLLRKRAEYTRANYENREQIARLTILANSLPRKDAERMKALVESNSEDTVNINSLDDEKKSELVLAMGRVGVAAMINEGRLSIDKKKVEGIRYIEWASEVPKKLTERSESSFVFWVDKKNEQKWDENEKNLTNVSKRIQLMLAKSQADALSEQEKAEFESLQREYISIKQKRSELASKNSELSVALPALQRDEIKVYTP